MNATESKHTLRHGILAATLGLVVLVAIVLFALRANPFGAPRPVIDYAERLRVLGSQHQGAEPDAPNGWDRFILACDKATAAIDALGGHDAVMDTEWDRATLRNATSEAIEVAAKVSAAFEQAGVFVDLDEALAAERMVRETYDDDPTLLTDAPELGSARQITRAMRYRLHERVMNNDGDAYARELERMLALAGRLSRQGGMLDHMIGLAIGSAALSEVRSLALERRLDQEMLNETASLMEQYLPTGGADGALDRERQWVLHGVQWTHANGGGSLRQSARLASLVGMPLETRASTERLCNRLFDAGIAESRRPLTERRDAPVDLDGMQSKTAGDLLADILMPSISRLVALSDRHRTEEEATRLIVALELHRAEHGEFPPTLEPFESPMSAIGLAPFVYRLTADGSSPYPYMLYAVGADGVDNGGTRPPGDPILGIKKSVPDVDWVFSVERAPFEGW